MDNFESYRTSRGLKIAQACEDIGISRSLFYAIKDGRQPVSDKMLHRLQRAMSEEPNGQKLMPYLSDPLIPPAGPIRVSEIPGSYLTRSEVRILIGEIRLRLDLLEKAFESMSDT